MRVLDGVCGLAVVFAATFVALAVAPAGCTTFGGVEEPTDAGSDSDTRPDAVAVSPSFLPEWAKAFAPSNAVADGGPRVLLGDAFLQPGGGILLTGAFSGAPATFGADALIPEGTYDAFVVGLDALGGHSFSRRYGDADEQFGTAITMNDGQAFTGFILRGKTQFGALPTVDVGLSYKGAVVRSDSAPNQLRVANGELAGNVFVRRVVPLTAGGAGVFGEWTSSLKFATFNQGRSSLTPAVFVANVLSLSGPDVVRSFGELDADCAASGLASNAAGHMLMTGRFKGSMDFGAAGKLTSTDTDAFVARLDPKLEPVWAKRISGSGNAEGLSAAEVPKTDDFVVAGTFTGEIGSPLGGTVVASGGADIFVVRYDGTGKALWWKTFGGAGEDRAQAVAVDAEGHVFVGGRFGSPMMAVGSGAPLVNSDKTGTGSKDAFVLWLDGKGEPVASARFGAAGDDSVDAIGIGAERSLMLAGNFTTAIDFGAGPLPGVGLGSAFVAKVKRSP